MCIVHETLSKQTKVVKMSEILPCVVFQSSHKVMTTDCIRPYENL